MTDFRAAALRALRNGDLAAAVATARAALAPGVEIEACALVLPEAARAADGVVLIEEVIEATVPSTARLVPGLIQFVPWAEPYTPYPLRLLALDRAAALAPGVIRTRAGRVLDDNTGFRNSELWEHGVEGFPGIVATESAIVLQRTARRTLELDAPAIYLPASPNYAAWLVGDLSRLAAYARLGGLPIVVHGVVQPFHRQSLDWLGVDASRVIEAGPDVRVAAKTLYYCTAAYLHQTPSARGAEFIRARAVERAPAATGRRIYLSRLGVERQRPILNEQAVVEAMAARGFTAVNPETHTVDEQARIAGAAEIVAGPYGANLANVLFAAHARKAFVIGTKGVPDFARLLSACRVPAWHTVARPVKIREGRTFSESHGFAVDLEELRLGLAAMLDGAS